MCCCGKCIYPQTFKCSGRRWGIELTEGCPPCPKKCKCPKTGKPVCGVDGKSYANSCLAKCDGVKTKCSGKCPCKKPCLCTQEYEPVCGVDGNTYRNTCALNCSEVKIDCKGQCPCKSHVCAQWNTNRYVELMEKHTVIHVPWVVQGWRRTAKGNAHVRSHANVQSCTNQFVVLMVNLTQIRAFRSVLG